MIEFDSLNFMKYSKSIRLRPSKFEPIYVI